MMKALMRQGAVQVVLLAAIFLLLLNVSSSQDAVRKVINKTAPQYPSLARSMNIHGVVKLEALVEPNGNVKSVDVKGGHPLLTQSAVTAVGHWKFEPAPHETKELIEIKFEPQ
ncbi:MAG: energy transducer TonB [Candidatus Sulfotelmatobacter sp.]